jgi:predicted aspartyl protease
VNEHRCTGLTRSGIVAGLERFPNREDRMNFFGDYSRRRLLGHGASALALAPSFVRAATDPPAPAIGETIQGIADLQNRLTLETMIDGKGPYHFLVDTGADSSVVAEDVAVSLGLLEGEGVVVQDIVRTLPAATVTLRNLSLGPIVIEKLSVPVLPRRNLGADGYLGLDAIDGHRVTFDFRRQQLTVDSPGSVAGWPSANEQIVRVNGSSGRLTAVSCTVDGVRAAAFIDSGAEMSIGNTKLFAELQKSGATYVNDDIVPVTGVTGGQAPGRLTSISAVRLGPIHYIHCFLLIADLQVFDVWGLADQPALLLGMNFLRKTSSVTIDFARKELRFNLLSGYLQVGANRSPAVRVML